MKVSIVIPIHNVSGYIERCLLSVFNQTYQNIECILVDDASPDDSMSKVIQIIASRSSSKDIKIITHEVNQGLSAARNTGVKASTGDYIYFLDSDDEISPDCIETLASCVTKDFQPDVVMGEMMTIGADRKKYPQLLLSDGCVLRDEQILTSFLKREWYEMACNKLVRRELFFEKGCWFYEGIVHEDNLWSFIVASNSKSLVVSKQITYNYYIHPNSITRKKGIKNFDSMYLIMEKMVLLKSSKSFCVDLTLFDNYLQNNRIYLLKCLISSDVEKIYVRHLLSKFKYLFVENGIEFHSLIMYMKWFLLFNYLRIIK